jgi:integrase
LSLYWPPTHFDKNSGRLLPRSSNDPDHADYTMMIDTELSKVNEIMKEYRLSERTLTIELLWKDYNSYSSRKDFLAFMLADAHERYKRKKIERNTRDGHIASLNKLKGFWRLEAGKIKTKKHEGPDQVPPLPFSSLTPKLLENFRAYMRAQLGNEASTGEKSLKDIRTYVYRAIADKHVFESPFGGKGIRVTRPGSMPDALTDEQLIRLMDLFEATTTPDNWRLMLRHFLFSCFTGLRISDAKAVHHGNIKDDWLVITPHKGRTRYKKIVKIPLHPAAWGLVETTLGDMFATYSEQYTNRLLDEIGQAAQIDFKMTTHTARHTFGTLFIELGGDVVTLKDYMGHSKIETTMKYVHLSEKRKKEKINVFDKLVAGRAKKAS